MAVTITAAELATAVRLTDSAEDIAAATRLLGVATAMIERHLGGTYADVPEAIVNEGCVRLAGWLYDAPSAGAGSSYANALKSSGTAAILLPWREISAGSTADAD